MKKRAYDDLINFAKKCEFNVVKMIAIVRKQAKKDALRNANSSLVKHSFSLKKKKLSKRSNKSVNKSTETN